MFCWLLVTLPLVHVGTIKVGLRLSPADLLALPLVIWVFVREQAGIRALFAFGPAATAAVAALFLIAVSAFSSAIGVLWITPDNLSWLANRVDMVRSLGPPAQRNAVETLRLAECAAVLVVTLAIVRTPDRLRRACELFALSGAIAAVYGLYVWIVLAFGMPLPLLPNTWAFAHLRRTAGTFPEPVAFSGFLLATMVFSLLLTEWRPAERRRWMFVLGIQASALLASLSTLGLLGLIALVSTMLAQWRARAAVRMLAVAGMTVVLLSFAAPTRLVYLQLVEKVFSTHSSWMDRVGAWESAAGMFAAYPVFGVGAGLYAYNQAHFFPVELAKQHAGGRINSIFLESLAEYGLAGTVPLLLIFLSVLLAIHAVRKRGSSLPDFRAAGYGGIAVILILAAGYYTSRYIFFWVFLALLIAAGATARHEVMAVSERAGS